MSEFKVIKTQEELDAILQPRLDRQKETFVKQYSDYDDLKKQVSALTSENTSLQSTISTEKEKYAGYDKNIDELNSKISGFETANLKHDIANEKGIPFALADRLVGKDEDELKADADRLSAMMKPKEPISPLKDSEPSDDKDSDKDSAYKNLINNLNLEGE